MFADPTKNLAALAIPAGSAVADFGCGSGSYALALARHLRGGGRVYALDVQKDLLAKLKAEAQRERLSNLEVVWANVEKVGGSKLADGVLDWVLISNTLFQTPARYTMLLEAKRVLKTGGHLAIIEWSDSFGGLGPAPAEVLPSAAARTVAESAGFRLVREFPAGDYHYGLLFQK